MDLDLCYLSASELVRRFAKKSTSPVELLQALQARIQAVDPKINAFVELYWEEAFQQAHAAESRYAGSGDSPRALEGIPFVVKDDIAVEGRRWASCSPAFADQTATMTNPTIARLLEAGAIMLGRSACPELAWSWSCTSPMHGTTHNPWNRSITSGGSSGGSAAALASGFTTLATGTDSAGSVRMPAAMCGVVGYKPPHGRNPKIWECIGDPFNEIGTLARTVEDCVLLQNVVSGPHPQDHYSLRPKLTIPWPLEDLKQLRIAYSMDLGFLEVAPDVRRNTLAMLERLRDLGATVYEVKIDWAKALLDATDSNSEFYAGGEFEEQINSEKINLFGEEMRPILIGFSRVQRSELMAGITASKEAWLSFSPILEDACAFVTPTVTTTEIPADWQMSDPIVINNRRVERFVTTMLFNVFSCCPAVTVPSGFAENGVPTGLQIAGRTFDDSTVFRIAAALDSQMGSRFCATDTRPDFADNKGITR